MFHMKQNREMKIVLICIGTELLKDKVNTNANLIAQNLSSSGFFLSKTITVGDELKDIEDAISQSLKSADILITCGGLGPTFDDLTREAVAKVLKLPLCFSKQILKKIKERFRNANLSMPRENERQAYLIRNAKPIINKVGTAPGQIIKFKSQDSKLKIIVLLPGPQKELLPMLGEVVCPYLKKRFGGTKIRSKVFHIFGYPESLIAERASKVTEKNWSSPQVKVVFGILAHHSIVDLKVTAESKQKIWAKKAIRQISREFYKVFGEDIYGEDEETLESVVGKLLKKRGETLAIAESCTGGLIAHKITGVPGSSAYFKEGVVTYSNESKLRLLGVKKETLKKFGAVSRQTAEEMAKGILKRSGSDWGISVTGIAGPSGGTKEKPVGLVWLAVAHKKQLFSAKKFFYGERAEIKEKSALYALDFLRRKI